MIPDPDNAGSYRPIVDAITSHDKFTHEDTIHDSDIHLAGFIQPDFWMVYEESWNTTGLQATLLHLSSTTIVCLPEESVEIDPFTRQNYKTTGFVERMRQA